MSSDDPEAVRAQYATEDGLAARASLYLYSGDHVDARDIVLEELGARAPNRVLEVGCGWGELAERLAAELGADVRALDLSPRMVELARERGVDAVVGDVQALPYEDESFDAVVAAWMLYHVPDLDLGLSELARVLRPGGALVAVTNAAADFHELWDLVGRELAPRLLTFRSENGEEHLGRRLTVVGRRDLIGPVAFSDADAIRRYVGSSELGRAGLDRIPKLEGPFVSTKHVTVFTAEKPA